MCHQELAVTLGWFWARKSPVETSDQGQPSPGPRLLQPVQQLMMSGSVQRQTMVSRASNSSFGIFKTKKGKVCRRRAQRTTKKPQGMVYIGLFKEKNLQLTGSELKASRCLPGKQMSVRI